jgi:mannose-6-phosphate isomerase
MHLLEAALAWISVTDGVERRPWFDLAHELVGLCLTRFRDASSGAIREYFDSEWCPAPGDAGRIVEPGHQFEWAWLLLQWGAVPGVDAAERRAARLAAAELAAVAERCGVDAERGVAINEVWDDLTTKDTDAKLWPQTERVKAWCALLEAAPTAGEAADACRHLRAAAAGMAAYLRADAPGLWHEVNCAVGGFQSGPSRASSFYHLAGAIAALDATVGLRMPRGEDQT